MISRRAAITNDVPVTKAKGYFSPLSSLTFLQRLTLRASLFLAFSLPLASILLLPNGFPSLPLTIDSQRPSQSSLSPPASRALPSTLFSPYSTYCPFMVSPGPTPSGNPCHWLMQIYISRSHLFLKLIMVTLWPDAPRS